MFLRYRDSIKNPFLNPIISASVRSDTDIFSFTVNIFRQFQTAFCPFGFFQDTFDFV